MQKNDQELNMPTDDQLMQSVRDDQCQRSFETLVQRWGQPIVRLCYRMVLSWDDAEDLAQEVFTRLYQGRSRYQTKAKFKTYLFRIAINRCHDFQRAASRTRRNQVNFLESKSFAADANDTIDRVRDALAKLPPIYREVIVLRQYEQLKFAQIAKLLELPVGTVASRMSKALRLVSEQLAKDLNTS